MEVRYLIPILLMGAASMTITSGAQPTHNEHATTNTPTVADAELTLTSETLSERGDVRLRLQLQTPASFYEFRGPNMTWTDPEEVQTHHLKLVLTGNGDLPVPGSKVHARIKALDGKDIGTSHSLVETWGPEGSYYGANVTIPSDVSSGTVLIAAEPPKFRRVDREHGGFFPSTINTTFTLMNFTTGSLATREQPTTSTVEEKVEWPEGRRPYVEPTPYPGSGNKQTN